MGRSIGRWKAGALEGKIKLGWQSQSAIGEIFGSRILRCVAGTGRASATTADARLCFNDIMILPGLVHETARVATLLLSQQIAKVPQDNPSSMRPEA
jgi:hypothetical protein